VVSFSDKLFVMLFLYPVFERFIFNQLTIRLSLNLRSMHYMVNSYIICHTSRFASTKYGNG
jgi:hypothetical protein